MASTTHLLDEIVKMVEQVKKSQLAAAENLAAPAVAKKAKVAKRVGVPDLEKWISDAALTRMFRSVRYDKLSSTPEARLLFRVHIGCVVRCLADRWNPITMDGLKASITATLPRVMHERTLAVVEAASEPKLKIALKGVRDPELKAAFARVVETIAERAVDVLLDMTARLLGKRKIVEAYVTEVFENHRELGEMMELVPRIAHRAFPPPRTDAVEDTATEMDCETGEASDAREDSETESEDTCGALADR